MRKKSIARTNLKSKDMDDFQQVEKQPQKEKKKFSKILAISSLILKQNGNKVYINRS